MNIKFLLSCVNGTFHYSETRYLTIVKKNDPGYVCFNIHQNKKNMKRILLNLVALVALGGYINAEKLEVTIKKTGEITKDGKTIAVSSDDAEQEDNAIDALDDDDLDAGWEGDPEKLHLLTMGLRFQGITIPKGAKIDSAYIVVTSHEGKDADDVAKITIYGDATDNATTFTEDALISARPKTTAQVKWTVNVEWTLWGTYRTPDLSSIVQEIVSRNGWVSGNSLAIIMAGENQGTSDVDNAREMEAFENIADPEDGGDGANHPERIPKLVVYYSTSNSISFTNNQLAFEVYPNPVKGGSFQIVLENNNNATARLYTIAGTLVNEYQFNGNSTIDTDNLSKGTYILNVISENNSNTKLIVIE